MSGQVRVGQFSGGVSAFSAVPHRLAPDAKRIMTMWEMLVWAFKTECVVAAVRSIGGTAPSGYGISSLWQAMCLGSHIPSRKGGMQELVAHVDALELYRWVEGLDRGEAVAIARYAGAGAPPPWDLSFGPDDDFRCTFIDSYSKLTPTPEVVIHPRLRTPSYCPVEYHGVSGAERIRLRARARRDYGEFVSSVEILRSAIKAEGVQFSANCVSCLGLERTPWINTCVKET